MSEDETQHLYLKQCNETHLAPEIYNLFLSKNDDIYGVQKVHISSRNI